MSTLGSVLPVMLALLVACGSTAVPAPSPSAPAASSASPSATPPPSPSPSPSPTAVPAAAVLAKLNDPDFAFAATISGELKTAGLTLPVTGEMAADGDDAYSLIVISAPGGPQRTEFLDVDGKGYTRASEASPWFVDHGKRGDNFLRSLSQPGMIEDTGTVTREGQVVRRFTTIGDVLSAADLGISTSGIASFSGRVDLLVDHTATLVGLVVDARWTQTTEGGAAPDSVLRLEFVITGSNPDLAGRVPDLVWDRLTSKRLGYSIGYPAAMTVTMGKGSAPDYIAASDGILVVARESGQPKGASLKSYVDAFVAATRRDLKVRPESRTDIRMAGHPGTLLKYHREFNGRDGYQQYALTLVGTGGYFVGLYGDSGNEQALDAFFEAVLGTLTITGA